MRPVTLHVANATRGLDAHVATIAGAFASAVETSQELLGLEGVDVVVIDDPKQTTVEWGVGAVTQGPHFIMMALDSSREITKYRVTTTLLHEFYHAMRWRGAECEGTLGRRLVSEGLAQLFEEQVLGEAPFLSRVNVSENEIRRANSALDDAQFDQGTWFDGNADVTKHFGYTYGYQLCRTYAQNSGTSAAELVDVDANEVLGTLRVPRSR